MARDERFTFLCNQNERRVIADLAARLQRSQSDAVRFVVIEAARKLSQDDSSQFNGLHFEYLHQETRGQNVS